MRVTEIRPVTKRKYQIEIEGEQGFVLYKGEVARFQIEKGEELSPEIYREILEEVLIKRAKLRAMHLLEQGDRTRKELEDRLFKSGYPLEAVQAAMAYVEGFHYIDDRRYALNYILGQRNKKGRVRIQTELQHRGVPKEVIEEAFRETEEDMDTREVIRDLIRKKRRDQGEMEEKERQKLWGFLMRRGFFASDISAVLREF